MGRARGIGMAVSRCLLAVVVLCAALATAAAFTEPSDGTFARPKSVMIELFITPAMSLLCVRVCAHACWVWWLL